jgi:hypothetical protein
VGQAHHVADALAGGDALADLDVSGRDDAGQGAADRAALDVLLGQPQRRVLLGFLGLHLRAAGRDPVELLARGDLDPHRGKQGLLNLVNLPLPRGLPGKRLLDPLVVVRGELHVLLGQLDAPRPARLLEDELGELGLDVRDPLGRDLLLGHEVRVVEPAQDLALLDLGPHHDAGRYLYHDRGALGGNVRLVARSGVAEALPLPAHGNGSRLHDLHAARRRRIVGLRRQRPGPDQQPVDSARGHQNHQDDDRLSHCRQNDLSLPGHGGRYTLCRHSSSIELAPR